MIGDNSLYRLTLAEIKLLQRGYAKLHEDSSDGGGKGRRGSDDIKLKRLKAGFFKSTKPEA